MENTTTDITQLSAADKKKLADQWKAEERAAKNKRNENIAVLKDLSTQFIENNIEQLASKQLDLETTVEAIFAGFSDILKLKSEIYGTEKLEQESHTVTHPEGKCSITIGYNINISFDGTESNGVQKIMDYLKGLSGDENNENAAKATKALNHLLKPNSKTGMLNPSKIIQLNQMRTDFNSPEFDDGLDIIIDAQSRTKGSSYVSGWKLIEVSENRTKKLEFRFTV